MPVSRRRKKTPPKAAQKKTAVQEQSTAAKLLGLWRDASLTQKRGVVFAALLIGSAAVASFAIRTARLPNVCYKSQSVLPFKTSIFAGVGDKGNLTTESERLYLIESGLNDELEKVIAKDVGIIFDKNSKAIGTFSGVNAAIASDKPITTLPSKFTLTIGKKEIEIEPQDRFKVTPTAVTIGQHSFPLAEVVTIIKAGNTALYVSPGDRVFYHLIGKDPRYACATP